MRWRRCTKPARNMNEFGIFVFARCGLINSMKPNLPRWLNFVFIFIVFVGLWISIAAAVSPSANPADSMLVPIPGSGSPTFGLIIGAILIVTIIIASVTLRGLRKS